MKNQQVIHASLDRYMVEKAFRQTKDSDLVSLYPLRHWTDSKIRCHLLTCVIALASLRLLELKVGGGRSAKTIMEEMHNLNRVLSWRRGARRAQEQIEEPTDLQAHILAQLGYQAKDGSVLQLVS